ncbi:hypothetical protein CEXT_58541 [Caerostris extrusa]|uniref:Uncharacterized protein n=1 Tax=Caerostris extrusa TaxID=172846 RepID=A0AAV4U081_CAEEX|nr:hypothetical protein CEXT_58541 [Caerostris extrusa]
MSSSAPTDLIYLVGAILEKQRRLFDVQEIHRIVMKVTSDCPLCSTKDAHETEIIYSESLCFYGQHYFQISIRKDFKG